MNGSGCVIVISVGLALLFLLQFAGKGLFGGSQSKQSGPAPQPIVDVYGTTITDKMLQDKFNALLSATIQRGSSPTPPPSSYAAFYYETFTGIITPALALQEAKAHNLKITDQDLIDAANTATQDQIMQAELQLLQSGQIKGSPSQAAIAAAFTKATGLSPDQIIAKTTQNAKKAVADPSQRTQLELSFADTIVPSKLAAQMTPTVAQLKATYVNMTAQRVFLTGPDAAQTAATVEQKAKSGTAFGDLITQYSKDTSNTKQKPSAVILSLGQSDLSIPPLNVLAGLKPGAISDPIDVPGGVAIYKVLTITPALPKDFAKNQATLLATYSKNLAQAQYNADIAKLQSSSQVDWKSTRWKALYDVGAAVASQNPTKPNWTSLVKEAQDAQNGPLAKNHIIGENKAGAIALYVSLHYAYLGATADAKKSLATELVQAASAVKSYVPGGDPDLVIAQTLTDQGMKSGIGQALISSANNNQDLTQEGQSIYETTQSLAQQDLKKGLITQDDFNQVQSALKTYRQSRADELKQQEEAQQEKAAAAAETAKEKAQYDAAQKNAGAKGQTAPTTGPAAPGASNSAPGPNPPASGGQVPFGTPLAPQSGSTSGKSQSKPAGKG